MSSQDLSLIPTPYKGIVHARRCDTRFVSLPLTTECTTTHLGINSDPCARQVIICLRCSRSLLILVAVLAATASAWAVALALATVTPVLGSNERFSTEPADPSLAIGISSNPARSARYNVDRTCFCNEQGAKHVQNQTSSSLLTLPPLSFLPQSPRALRLLLKPLGQSQFQEESALAIHRTSGRVTVIMTTT